MTPVSSDPTPVSSDPTPDPTPTAAPTSRRDALRLGGIAVSLGGMIAACGEDRGGDTAPGRVGNAPEVTTPPDYEVNDIVLLRTASSLELTAIEVYETALDLDGAVPDELVPLVERLIEDHRDTAATMESLTVDAGGEAWTCPNPWFMDRLVAPTIDSILSPIVGVVLEDTSMVQVLGEELPISDVVTTSQGDITLISSTDGLAEGDELEFERLAGEISDDIVVFATALENLAAATHQELASAVTITEARVAHVEAAAREARHGSILALATRSGEYLSPTLVGDEDVPDERGQFRQFSIPSRFGQTAQIEIKAGPGDINNVRTSALLQTPADNSFAYQELSCDA